MSKYDAILRYKTSMSIFKKWLADGVITEADLLAVNAILAEKYGLSSRSIFLENDLLYVKNRVIYGAAKGDRHGHENNKT